MLRYYFYRLAGLICPLLPTRLGYWLFARLGDLAFWLTYERQTTYRYNLRRLLGEEATPAQMRAVARRAYQNLLKNYFDLFRAHRMSKEEIAQQLAGVQGMEHLEEAMQRGKGVIAGSGHFGSWDMVIQLAAVYLNTRIVVPNERFKPEKLFQYILRLRASQGIDMVPLDLAPRALIKALREKQIAGLAYDRDITKTGPVVNFLGKPTQLPDGAVQLSLKYGAPVLMGFSVRQPDNRSMVYIEPPLEFQNNGNLQNDIQAGVQKMADILAKYYRQYPDQWLMFQKIWEDDDDG